MAHEGVRPVRNLRIGQEICRKCDNYPVLGSGGLRVLRIEEVDCIGLLVIVKQGSDVVRLHKSP